MMRKSKRSRGRSLRSRKGVRALALSAVIVFILMIVMLVTRFQ